MQIEWTLGATESGRQQAGPPSPAVITVSMDLTRIAGPLETIVIDYPHSRLYRIGHKGGHCRVYPFGAPHAGQPWASLTVASDAGDADLRHVSFGMQAALAQSAVAPVPRFCGGAFPNCRAEVRIAGDLPHAADLSAIAAHHAAMFQQYPLLRRIDPLGLIGPLRGFPVATTSLSPLGTRSMRLQSPPRATNIPIELPRDCPLSD